MLSAQNMTANVILLTAPLVNDGRQAFCMSVLQGLALQYTRKINYKPYKIIYNYI